MASRVRIRISFGAFANLKNNQQQQIGLNTLITSIKKIVSTFNNNFSYIVNSFNALMQFKYDINKYGIFIDKEKNDTYLMYANAETDYELVINRISLIKKRLDFLEQGNFNTNYVNSEIMWSIKNFNFYNSSKTISRQVITPSNKTQYSLVAGETKYKIFFMTKTSSGFIITNSVNNSLTGQPFRWYTDKVKILSGYTKDIDFGPLYARTATDILGPFTFTLTFSGLLSNKFPSHYKKLEEL